jgi:hypothetical protein
LFAPMCPDLVAHCVLKAEHHGGGDFEILSRKEWKARRQALIRLCLSALEYSVSSGGFNMSFKELDTQRNGSQLK